MLFSQGLGQRHLWQDEMETAERARSVAEQGFPKVIDSEGRISINSTGREIEDGDYHRYSPWGQFYWGAWGILVGKKLGWTPDFSVRFPFAFAHAATTSLLSTMILQGLKVHPIWAIGVTLIYAAHSVRLVHNRSARYHALLDLLFMIGLFALWSIMISGPKLAWWSMASSIFFLPQVHTLGGAVAASFLGLALLLLPQGLRPISRKKTILFGLIPGLLSLGVLLVLVRPWEQSIWGSFGNHRFRSLLKDFEFIKYSLYTGLIHLVLLWRTKNKRWFWTYLGLGAYLLAIVRVMDFHPFSQTRYYLHLAHWFLWAPLFLLGFSVAIRQKMLVVSVVLIFLTEVTKRFPFYQGVKVVVQDSLAQDFYQKQPLMQAINWVRTHAESGERVFIDYVPQFINWYLPGFQIGALPDPSSRHPLSTQHPVYDQARVMPRYHIIHSSMAQAWNCAGKCQYQHINGRLKTDRYTLTFLDSGESRDFCVLKRWPVDHWNNAPFSLLQRKPESVGGMPVGELILAHACQD